MFLQSAFQSFRSFVLLVHFLQCQEFSERDMCLRYQANSHTSRILRISLLNFLFYEFNPALFFFFFFFCS
jgi:hypothetical protein